MASSLTPKYDPEPYWKTVEDCLVELHHMKRHEAQRKLSALRLDVESVPPGRGRDIFYHIEEFDLACGVAGQELDLKQYRDAYDQIVIRHYPVVGLYIERQRLAADRVSGDAWMHGHTEVADQEPEAPRRRA
jgi:hypothetical protein